MFVRSSKHRDLQALYEQAIEQRDEAVKAADEHVCQIVSLAREIDALRETTRVVPVPQPGQDERLRESRAENDRLRAENQRLQRDVARLQQRLDDALGLNTAAMEEGARWQERRTDVSRPRAVKEGS